MKILQTGNNSKKQKDNFIGVVSHELKKPLTGIKAFSQLLERHLAKSGDEKGTFFLTKMTSQMERLTQLMASFVNVYNIQNGKLILRKTKFNIDNLIKSVVSDFQYTTKSHILVYKGGTNLKINADKERTVQVLINLLSNAIKYSKCKKVIVSSKRISNNIVVTIQDFGLGIPTEEQNKIFDRFFRVKSKRDKGIFSGLGLGLYISYEIIKQHKGRLWVDSIEGKWSKFHFSLPI